ncbi:MAG: NAD-dependent epimerase/dehydratase family protein [Anaerovoracaceae bacterium]|jgi:nucleoside-diphosphate-sugar epimerase
MKYTKQYWNDVENALDSIPDYRRLYGKSILITGASGMICSTIIDLLLHLNRTQQAGIRIIAAGRNKEKIVGRFEGFTEDDGICFSFYDATSPDPIDIPDSPDYIIHGASNANPGIYMREPVETMLANITGLNSMLRFAAEKSIRRILYVSSSEVYGRHSGQNAYREDDYGFLDILNERASYPSSKRAGESLCIAYCMEYDVDAVTVRPGHIYGPSIQPSDNRASAEFSRRAAAGENIIMKSAGTQLRSYCYTLDCATAILTVLLNGKSRQAYNISNPNSICTIREIAEAMADAAGVQVIFDVPTEVEKKSYNLMDNSSLNSEKLEALGWVPRFSLRQGVESTIDLLKEE